MRRFSILILMLMPAAAYGAEPPKEWTPELQMKVRGVGAVNPSPDGKYVVWTVTRAVMEGEKSENDTQIWLGSSDGTRSGQLTRGAKSASSPQWSPDGRQVYFSSDRDGKQKIYCIPVDGGEAEPVFAFDGNMGEWRLSPDGRQIAFTGRAKDEPAERAKKEKTDWTVVDDTPRNNSLWLVSSNPEEAAKAGPRQLVAFGYHVSSIEWAPDSLRVAFEHRPRPGADFGSRSDIAEVVVESGETRDIAATAVTEARPLYSPDGRYLAFVKAANESTLAAGRILLMDRSKPPGSGERELPMTDDGDPRLVGWTGDSRAILFEELRGTKAALQRMPVDGPASVVFVPQQGTAAGFALNRSATHAGFVRQAPDTPPEACVMVVGGLPLQVSKANADIDKPPIGETHLIRWKAKDGKDVEGLLTLPVGYQKGTRYPLILNIHGGPSGVFTESFIGGPGLYPVASFAARGYAVLRCNPRGSTGYGAAFREMVVRDWGGADYSDLMGGVDTVIAMGVADPDRMAVMGWSYGGYMTAWTVTQTTRFRAAAVGAGITDNISMFGTQDVPTLFADYFGGGPFQDTKLYLDRSPMYHVANVKTPTLILHGERDERVPPGQAKEFYNALKRRGVATKLVFYPRQPHGPREPKFVLDVMKRHLAWADKYVMGREEPPAPANTDSAKPANP